MERDTNCSTCFYWWRHRRSELGECLKTAGGAPVFENKTSETSVCCFYAGKGLK